ncbi:MAG TPA: GNAT family N-acetyltransferase [Acidimicrobiia bacterium]
MTSRDRSDVVTALSGAFSDDPVFTWIFPDDDRRRDLLPPAFDVFAEAIAHHGVSHAAGDGVGAALWVPPGEAVADDEEAFAETLLALSPEDAGRMEACLALLGEHHPEEPCWYLNFIGVVPERQGEGIGSLLLREGVERSDATGVAAYLDATSTDNRRLYERHGFRVLAELTLPDGPPVFPMWRDPGAG